MSDDSLAIARANFESRFAKIRNAGPRLSPLDLHERMNAIRELAVAAQPELQTAGLCSFQQPLLAAY